MRDQLQYFHFTDRGFPAPEKRFLLSVQCIRIGWIVVFITVVGIRDRHVIIAFEINQSAISGRKQVLRYPETMLNSQIRSSYLLHRKRSLEVLVKLKIHQALHTILDIHLG
ncbi:hypothetical protein D3C86_1364580 [compost metagenome]